MSDDTTTATTPALILMARIRGEFRDMPGLSLTIEQAARLFGLETSECRSVLDALVDGRLLARASDGRYRSPGTV